MSDGRSAGATTDRWLLRLPTALYLALTVLAFAGLESVPALVASAALVFGGAVALPLRAFRERSRAELRRPWALLGLAALVALLAWPIFEVLLSVVVLHVLGPISGAEGGLQSAGALAAAVLWSLPMATVLASSVGVWLMRRRRRPLPVEE